MRGPHAKPPRAARGCQNPPEATQPGTLEWLHTTLTATTVGLPPQKPPLYSSEVISSPIHPLCSSVFDPVTSQLSRKPVSWLARPRLSIDSSTTTVFSHEYAMSVNNSVWYRLLVRIHRTFAVATQFSWRHIAIRLRRYRCVRDVARLEEIRLLPAYARL